MALSGTSNLKNGKDTFSPGVGDISLAFAALMPVAVLTLAPLPGSSFSDEGAVLSKRQQDQSPLFR